MLNINYILLAIQICIEFKTEYPIDLLYISRGGKGVVAEEGVVSILINA